MYPESGSPFESIESAHEFVALLGEVVAEAKKDVDADLQRELIAIEANPSKPLSIKPPRRVEALRVVSYGLEKLEFHMSRSRRILNDLRSLRRLLFAERTTSAVKVQPKAVRTASAEQAVPRPSTASPAIGPTTTTGGVAAA